MIAEVRASMIKDHPELLAWTGEKWLTWINNHARSYRKSLDWQVKPTSAPKKPKGYKAPEDDLEILPETRRLIKAARDAIDWKGQRCEFSGQRSADLRARCIAANPHPHLEGHHEQYWWHKTIHRLMQRMCAMPGCSNPITVANSLCARCIIRKYRIRMVVSDRDWYCCYLVPEEGVYNPQTGWTNANGYTRSVRIQVRKIKVPMYLNRKPPSRMDYANGDVCMPQSECSFLVISF